MIAKTKLAVLATLLLFGAAGCVDLNVVNPNEPARVQVLRTASDMEALVSGAWTPWWRANNSVNQSPGMILSVASFQHSSNAANFGMLTYGALPRVPTQNDPTHPDWPEFSSAWFLIYRSLAAVADGMRALEADTAMQRQLGASQLRRVRAQAKFMQGLGHASIAVLHNQGFAVDETRPGITGGRPADIGAPVGYQDLMAAAINYWEQAIALGEAGGFDPIPEQWMGRATTPAQLAQLAYSLRAEYRASVARTPDERRDVSQGGIVDWRAVLTDIERGIDHWTLNEPRLRQLGVTRLAFDAWTAYTGDAHWAYASYMITGMADQSGKYQQWLAQPIAQRHPTNAAHGPFLIQTPDQRFPRGTSVNEQFANAGLHWQLPDPHWYGGNIAGTTTQWGNPARGTWRWSYYHRFEPVLWYDGIEDRPWVDRNRLRLLAAEAHFHLGNPAAAAELINVTRVGVGGLSPTNAAGVNTSCVPRLPSGQCGGLWEMLKWEQRESSWGRGPFSASWYFDSRGWGDLYRGTPLHLPIPQTEAVVLGLPIEFLGGVGRPGGAPGSTYAWPFE